MLTRIANGLLRRARTALRPFTPASNTLSSSGLWLDHPRAEAMLAQRTQSEFLRKHTLELIRDGVTRVPGVVSAQTCDQLVQEFNAYCGAHPESAEYKDAHGYHSRLCNFHLSSPAALSVGLHPKVLELLDFAFGQRTAVCSSLVFEKGSQQSIHRDAPFFHTNPEGLFFGVWTALEDVSPDAGPLTYYVGGHRIAIDRLEIAGSLQGRPHSEMFAEYIRRIHEACERERLPFLRADFMRKGDVLVWHPQLPHGGSPIKDPQRTRKSMVVHYMPETSSIHGIEAFFSPSFPGVPNPRRPMDGRMVIDHGQPRFERNY